MEESTEPKKYPPTEKKLRDLKQKGQFPKTELAEPTLELVVFTVIIILALYYLFEYSNEWFSAILQADVQVGLDSGYDVLWWCIGGLALLKLVMAAFEWVMINKAVVSTEALGLKMDKINPVNGAKNIFGIEAISRSLRKILELLFLLFLLKYVADVLGSKLYQLHEINNYPYFIYYLMLSILAASVFYLIFGVCVGTVDFMAEKYHFMQKNRMTFTEMKNELKETEGSPEIKYERKRRMREVMETPITQGRRPNFALANPTHILVPICYDPKIERVPVVLKICTESLALEERSRLETMDIPIIENVPLARAIYTKMKQGEDFLPPEFFRDVAIIISRLKRKNNV
ncbi:EscU/YscU/HrcU family type III secretion system export apparatus switch protein [Grimontia hollisae]|uniref:EscU/YscU/HrcU family type III secretion system export apparatus switch protein n=1 Tax=Grimontia hollisae TaxID=673 RepID=UPI001303AEF6|nr:EscU/YscU/HrcU family type III secretion system export apparatus switch protein [Grimontia hollisae]